MTPLTQRIISEARESLEKRWRDINFAMSGVPVSSETGQGMPSDFGVDLGKFGKSFPVEVTAHSISPVEGVRGEFLSHPVSVGGEIRLDTPSSTRSSPILWHELGHGTQASAFDTAMSGSGRNLFHDTPAGKAVLSSRKAAAQIPVPYNLRNVELDARAFEAGKRSQNTTREQLTQLYRSGLATMEPGQKTRPSSDIISDFMKFRDSMIKNEVSAERGRITQGKSTPLDTPVPTAFGLTRPPTDEEIKIRKSAIRNAPQIERRAVQNVADMAKLGFEEGGGTPAMIKGVLRQLRKQTGSKQFTPQEWPEQREAYIKRLTDKLTGGMAPTPMKNVSSGSMEATPRQYSVKSGGKFARALGPIGLALGALGVATGEAKAEDVLYGLHPLSIFDSGQAAGIGSDKVDTDYDKAYDSQGRPRRSAWPANATDAQGKPITNWSPEK